METCLQSRALSAHWALSDCVYSAPCPKLIYNFTYIEENSTQKKKEAKNKPRKNKQQQQQQQT